MSAPEDPLGYRTAKLEAAKHLWLHTNVGAKMPESEDDLIAWYESAAYKAPVDEQNYVKLDALAPSQGFEFWTLRTGACPPTRVSTDEIMIVEHTEDGPQVRMVIVLDSDDGITLHPSGNFEVRTVYLPPDENRKYF